MQIRTKFGKAHAIYDYRRIIRDFEMSMTCRDEYGYPTTRSSGRKHTPSHSLLPVGIQVGWLQHPVVVLSHIRSLKLFQWQEAYSVPIGYPSHRRQLWDNLQEKRGCCSYRECAFSELRWVEKAHGFFQSCHHLHKMRIGPINGNTRRYPSDEK